jgi:hypothetical protein
MSKDEMEIEDAEEKLAGAAGAADADAGTEA